MKMPIKLQQGKGYLNVRGQVFHRADVVIRSTFPGFYQIVLLGNRDLWHASSIESNGTSRIVSPITNLCCEKLFGNIQYLELFPEVYWKLMQ